MQLRKIFAANRTPRHLQTVVRPTLHRMMTAAVWATPHDGWAAEHFERVLGQEALYLRRVGGFATRESAAAFVVSAGARLPRFTRYIGGRNADVIIPQFA